MGALAILRPHARETNVGKRRQRQLPPTAASERGAAGCSGECGGVQRHVFQERCERLLLQGVVEGRNQHDYCEWGGVAV